jgi:hypothetical protein
MDSPGRPVDDDVPPDDPLTTKEGWGAFVRHTPEPPTLLSTEKLAALPPRRRADYDQMLRDYHADLPLVNTPKPSRRSSPPHPRHGRCANTTKRPATSPRTGTPSTA